MILCVYVGVCFREIERKGIAKNKWDDELVWRKSQETGDGPEGNGMEPKFIGPHVYSLSPVIVFPLVTSFSFFLPPTPHTHTLIDDLWSLSF